MRAPWNTSHVLQLKSVDTVDNPNRNRSVTNCFEHQKSSNSAWLGESPKWRWITGAQACPAAAERKGCLYYGQLHAGFARNQTTTSQEKFIQNMGTLVIHNREAVRWPLAEAGSAFTMPSLPTLARVRIISGTSSEVCIVKDQLRANTSLSLLAWSVWQGCAPVRGVLLSNLR